MNSSSVIDMKRLFLVLILLAAFICCGSKRRAGDDSILQLVATEGTETQICSALSINEDKGYFLTADHCILTGNLRLDDQIAWLVYENANLDLAVIESPGAAAPAFKPSTLPQYNGMAVQAIGYANAWSILQHTHGYISSITPDILFFDFFLVHGMSGGPILDTNGDVIAISQRINDQCNCSFSTSTEDIVKATGKFWEK